MLMENEPEYLPCVRRQGIVYLDLDGTKTQKQRCAHQVSTHFGTDVSIDDCASCPVRVVPELRHLAQNRSTINRDFLEPKIMSDGSIVYPKTGFEPPVCPQGYKRKSDAVRSDDAWVFIPLWLPCADRAMANRVRRCGCVNVYKFCLSLESGISGQAVTPEICENCHARRPPEDK